MLSTFMIQSCAKSVFLPPLLLSEGISKGKSNTCCHSCPAVQNKINSERKAVRDLQCSALINEGLYQLGAHDWCVNISAVTQFGTRRRVTSLFTGHKDHKQALATSKLPSVNSWVFQRIYGFSTYFNFISIEKWTWVIIHNFTGLLRHFVFRKLTRIKALFFKPGMEIS